MEFFLFWIIGGVIVALIANSKGKGTFGWFVYGFLIFPVALVHVLVSPRNAAVVAHREVQSGALKKCPHCAELIKVDARVCRYCQRDIYSTRRPRPPIGPEGDTVSQPQFAIPTIEVNGRQVRKAYQFLQVRVQKMGRGITNEILMLHVNGKQFKAGVRTLDELLAYLGSQGFEVVTTVMETEGVYTYFFTLQREVLTDQPIETDIFDELANAREGATFGQGTRGFFEFVGMMDNW